MTEPKFKYDASRLTDEMKTEFIQTWLDCGLFPTWDDRPMNADRKFNGGLFIAVANQARVPVPPTVADLEAELAANAEAEARNMKNLLLMRDIIQSCMEEVRKREAGQ